MLSATAQPFVNASALLLSSALAISCASSRSKAPDTVVVERIMEKLEITVEDDAAPAEKIQPLTFFADRLAVGDIIAVTPEEELGASPVETENTPEDTNESPAPFEKVFSLDDSISSYGNLTEKEREILNGRWRELLATSEIQEFPVEISRLEYSGISRVSENPEAKIAAKHLIGLKQNLVLGISSGLDQLVHEEFPTFLERVETKGAKELKTDSQGRVSSGNFYRLRKKLSEDLKTVKQRLEAGEVLHVIGKVGFADRVSVGFTTPSEESSEADLDCLSTAGKVIFSRYPDLTDHRDASIPQVDLTRDPRIFWGFVAYQLALDEEGKLVANLEAPLQLENPQG